MIKISGFQSVSFIISIEKLTEINQTFVCNIFTSGGYINFHYKYVSNVRLLSIEKNRCWSEDALSEIIKWVQYISLYVNFCVSLPALFY